MPSAAGSLPAIATCDPLRDVLPLVEPRPRSAVGHQRSSSAAAVPPSCLYVLDTSSLLRLDSPTQLSAIRGGRSNHLIVIPWVVLNEIDKHGKLPNNNSRPGPADAEKLAMLRRKSLAIRDFLLAVVNQPDSGVLIQSREQRLAHTSVATLLVNDDHILACAMFFRDAVIEAAANAAVARGAHPRRTLSISDRQLLSTDAKPRPVFLVTEDKNLSLKACAEKISFLPIRKLLES